MESEIWQKLINTWERGFYTNFFLELLQILTLIIGLITFRLERIRVFFLLFIFVSLTAHPDYYSAFFNFQSERQKTYIWIYCQIVISVFEFIAYYYFFFKILSGRFIKKVMSCFIYIITVLLILFCIYSLNKDATSKQLVNYFYYLISVDLFFIITPALAYYFEIFKKPVIPKLFNNNPFLITTSIFFPYITIIPFLFIADYLSQEYRRIYNIFFSAHYVLFCFLFIVLLRAFLCKKPLTT